LKTYSALAKQLQSLEHPTIVAVDGRSGSGKSMFANKLAAAPKVPIVHTDDISWHHSFFDW
jgi:uridine kinase